MFSLPLCRFMLTEIGAICVGEEYPSAEIIGNDLSAIQPTWVPPNVKFEVDDVEQLWVYDKFNYIFSCYMSTSILDWLKLVENVFKHLYPGGWAEFQDFDLLYYSEDGLITDNHYLLKWMKLFIDTARTKLNREPCPGPRLEGWIRHAGFMNVAFSLKIFCGVLGMPIDEVLVMLAQIRQELYARKYHALFDFYVVYGQKP
ncbi:uncharacterized protein BKA55DRAFT_582058 [Fusarium redolens]|uniref:Methyltransferase n=1 Tax=Fusarium redolens TaxID=48865 RepID=A0A9P9JT70_FUSRE|nr:uncharacterized protein BKA55DRAFT_582058 [Fusarium redolens]KAH7231255.1 hypothetical protein BKA55DRAFT_582058 [Fusarium redolens]